MLSGPLEATLEQLGNMLARFSEGHDTADLRRATAVLERLRA
jgi:hypothetical protein